MPSRLILTLFLTSLLLLSLSSFSLSTKLTSDDLDDEEDLSFLEDENDVASSSPLNHHHDDSDWDEFDDEFDESQLGDDSESEDEYYSMPEVDEKDVVVLKERNFTEVIEANAHVLVEFYAPWCGHCQELAPEYAAAATELKSEGVDVVVAKVDATEETELANQFDVEGFPTMIFFVDGVHKPYNGQRTREAIVTWIKKKTGPGVYNITTTEEAEKILSSNEKLVLAYLDSLTGSESDEFSAVSRLEDDVNFYQTVEPNVAKLFEIDTNAKRPSLVLHKKDFDKINHFDGKFAKSAITEFVFANKLPLVTNFTEESASLIFEGQIKKQLLLFATSNDSEKVLPTFREVAKYFKGKIVFAYVQLDDEDIGKPVADYFGVTGDAPKVIAYTGNEGDKNFIFDGEVTLDKVKAFGDDFMEDKLKPFYKSDPIPENNDGDVKIVVGNNFDEIVLDESKDVLLEIYAPWCGHCQSLEPTYNKLAGHLRDINSIVIAKMDGTTNEHSRVKADGFPTILFFPAGNKSFDPITVDTDRTVVAFYKFLRKNAAIPFKLPKPASTPKAEGGSDPKDSIRSSDAEDLKDEL